MANSILNNTVILRCANWVMEILYENLKAIVKEEKINDATISNFISNLDQEVYGRGFIHVDINEYFKDDNKNLQLLAYLVDCANKKALNDSSYTLLIYNRIAEFKKRLVE